MSIHYLMDENVGPLYKRQLLNKSSETCVYAVGNQGVHLERHLIQTFCFGAKKMPVS